MEKTVELLQKSADPHQPSVPSEDSTIYECVAYDALSVIDMVCPRVVRFVDGPDLRTEIVQAIRNCVSKKPAEVRVSYLATGWGKAHEELSRAWIALESCSPTHMNGRHGLQRVLHTVGEVVYFATNMRLANHLIELQPAVAWKFERDLRNNVYRLPFNLGSGTPTPRSARSSGAIERQASEFLQVIVDDLASGYTRGNGYAANPTPLNTCYEEACTYVAGLVLGVAGLSRE